MATRAPLVFILPLAHLCLCFAIALGFISTEGGWMWFPAFFVDFPFSILLLPLLNVASPLLVFGILGTIWWYFLSVLLALLYRTVLKWAGFFFNRRQT
jgi:hypothetical protein